MSVPPDSIDPGSVAVLLVCMGNICRSPVAEGVLRQRLAERLPELPVRVDSAGTHSYHIGAPPDERAQAVARRRGIDISRLRARAVVEQDFFEFDLILAMDEDNLASLRERAPPSQQARIGLYMDFAPGNGPRNVPDPYYGGAIGFERVMDLVEQATEGLLEELERRLLGPGR